MQALQLRLAWMLSCLGIALIACSVVLTPSQGIWADDGSGDGVGGCAGTTTCFGKVPNNCYPKLPPCDVNWDCEAKSNPDYCNLCKCYKQPQAEQCECRANK